MGLDSFIFGAYEIWKFDHQLELCDNFLRELSQVKCLLLFGALHHLLDGLFLRFLDFRRILFFFWLCRWLYRRLWRRLLLLFCRLFLFFLFFLRFSIFHNFLEVEEFKHSSSLFLFIFFLLLLSHLLSLLQIGVFSLNLLSGHFLKVFLNSIGNIRWILVFEFVILVEYGIVSQGNVRHYGCSYCPTFHSFLHLFWMNTWGLPNFLYVGLWSNNSSWLWPFHSRS